MLKTNKKFNHPLIGVFILISGFFLFQYLTFIPEYSNATTTITTPVYDESKKDTRTLSDITYMQEMTSSICNRSKLLEEKQLIDKRDGKAYWVTKLAGNTNSLDSECWMTQNLDLDLTQNGLSAELSDMEMDWTKDDTLVSPPTQTTTKEKPTVWPSGVDQHAIVASYDPGYNVFVDGKTSKAATGKLAYGQPDGDFSLIDAHYLQGNYYSHNAAAAGSALNLSMDNTEAPSSICPRGWKLPISGSDNGLNINSEKGSFGKMLALNSITDDEAGATNIIRQPLYFVMGGVYTGSGTTASYTGSRIYYWSSTIHDIKVNGGVTYGEGYGLYSNGAVVWPADAAGFTRRYGMFVRCVARTNVPDAPAKPDIDNPNISVEIPNILTLEVYTDSSDHKTVDIATSNTDLSTGTFTAKVTSNQDYSISLNAAGDSTSLINSKDGDKIAEIPTITTAQPTPGISSWGIRTCSDLDTSSCTELYKPLPAKNITNTFLSGTSGIHQHLFQIGVSTSPNLPSGTYSTSILVTASQ